MCEFESGAEGGQGDPVLGVCANMCWRGDGGGFFANCFFCDGRRWNICYFDSAAILAIPASLALGDEISPVFEGQCEANGRMAGLGCRLGHVPDPPDSPAGYTLLFAVGDYTVGKEAECAPPGSGGGETIAAVALVWD